jgi:histidinol phosphatase-like PHP family hydrolase
MKFIIDHDLHIHSRLSSCSNHPEQTPTAILKYAVANGFKHICLTDHFWDEKVPGASDWYRPQNITHVAQSIPLPEADGVTFHFGCETDFDKFKTLGISRETIDTFDFVIVPTSHLHMQGFTIEPEDTSVARRAALYMERNHALLDMDLPFTKMGLAHFTCCLLDRGCEGNYGAIMDAITDTEYAEFFTRLAKCGMGLEINTSLEDASLRSILRPYRIARDCGCKFYLGSDAHTPNEFKMAHSRFSAMVDALGLTEDDKFAFV